MLISATTMENRTKSPQKAKSKMPILSSLPPEYIPKESKVIYSRNTCIYMFIAALFTITE
jgi:hypothetical protein